ncbi:hypothetical protein ACFPVX_12460 [Cohnella faecalis]|uniref:DUF2802 domain-containing protein n=1 Tax=Cohnella faecalis TaxID=2315694 RepID=A0A398CE25_9BACL|nr:hypothetical protein [Cohnella faecalis]RIE00880.1 hypothetical protein D3H35_25955 [Cohnella faecalis]RIE03311.1 hypothetical protein D3H35_11525 [Cohnella faecalis]
MSPSPWLSIVLFGIVIFGYAWMMPRRQSNAQDRESANEAAYDKLLEDLELENRELVDAVAKFKREQDETVERLGRRVRDMEQQMRSWSEQRTSTASPPSSTEAPTVTERIETESASAIAVPFAAVMSAAETASYPVPEPAETEPAAAATTIRVRYAELLEQHARGRSVEQIARSFGMNKGEVQLILQLARREEEPIA